MAIMDNSRETISVLNELIQTSKDGEAGFKSCAEDINRPELKTLLSERSRRCGRAAADLQQIVRRLGGDPEDSSSLSGTMHRRWVDLKSAVTGQDDEAVLSECERGEDVAKEQYREALQHDLPPDIRTVVQQQYEGVLKHHDEIKMLRNAERARH